MGMLEDAQGRLCDLVTVLSEQLEQALTSQSRSARASMAAMGRDGSAVSGCCHVDESTRGLIMEAMGRDGE
jgi:hypothetical protein